MAPERRNVAEGILISTFVAALAYLLLVTFSRYAAVVFCGVLVAVALSGLAQLLNSAGHLAHGLAVGLVLVASLLTAP